MLSPRAGAVARFNSKIGLLDMSKAHVNCHEMPDEFNLYSALILSELVPETNCCGSEAGKASQGFKEQRMAITKDFS